MFYRYTKVLLKSILRQFMDTHEAFDPSKQTISATELGLIRVSKATGSSAKHLL